MIPRDSSRASRAAFTRTELVFTILAVVTVTLLLTSCGKASHEKDLARCKDNLKNVALALSLWIEDADANWFPWDLRNRAWASDNPLRSECWFYMMSLSNQLTSPQLLVCPADKRARIAKTWDMNPGSGFGAASYGDRACSYAMALDGGSVSGTGPIPLDVIFNSIVFMDRHLGGKSAPEQCRSTQIASTGFQKPFDLWWKPELHGTNEGNVTFMDGSMHTASESMVERALPTDLQSRNSTHVLFPKRPEKN